LNIDIVEKNQQVDVTRFQYIDSIRGLAILGVMLFHVSINVKGLNPVFSEALNSGNYGVQLFFIASALTLFMSCYSRFPKEGQPVLFYGIRRFFRIAPLFWIAIVFYQFFYSAPGRIFLAEDAKPWHVFVTAFFIHGWHPDSVNNIVPGGWSIAVEMTFYLFVPFFYKYLRKLKYSIFVAVAACLFSILFGKIMDIYLSPVLISMNYNTSQI